MYAFIFKIIVLREYIGSYLGLFLSDNSKYKISIYVNYNIKMHYSKKRIEVSVSIRK